MNVLSVPISHRSLFVIRYSLFVAGGLLSVAIRTLE